VTSGTTFSLANALRLLYLQVRGQATPGAALTATKSLKTAMKFRRITVDPKQMGGAPCIRGLRIPVAAVVGMVADEMTTADILAAYPDLERDDVQEALRYAADAVRERELPLMVP
jgi:uncharacterized protein (DUF433 family)